MRELRGQQIFQLFAAREGERALHLRLRFALRRLPGEDSAVQTPDTRTARQSTETLLSRLSLWTLPCKPKVDCLKTLTIKGAQCATRRPDG